MTTKQRAYLKSLAMTMDPIFQIGKSSMTPSLTQAISEALDARELIMVLGLAVLLIFIAAASGFIWLVLRWAAGVRKGQVRIWDRDINDD